MRLSKLLVWMVIGLLLVSSAGATELEVQNDDLYVYSEIINGYYTDAEGDGKENDVITEFTLNITVLDDAGKTLLEEVEQENLKFKFSLIMPSGKKFSYSYEAETYLQQFPVSYDNKSVNLHIRMYFWDHAVESGDYTFVFRVFLNNTPQQDNIAELVFDPPGGDTTEPPEPSAELI